MRWATGAGAASVGVLLATTGLVASCVSDGHPLGGNGTVLITVVQDGPLYATDLLDENGAPAGPRQTPFSTDVVLQIDEDDELGHGAIVNVHVEPAEALALGEPLDRQAEGANHEDGSGPTCGLVDGAFQCRGNDEGFARFSVTSVADWNGEAKIVVTWSNLDKEAPVTILPAGIPPDATNFQLIGVGANERIPATFQSLACSTDAVPGELDDKWPEGRIRAREVFVRATPPQNDPGVLENAPVIVESLSSEGALSLDETCAERTTRIRVLLDEKGESPRFFTCFSDIGGRIEFGVASGKSDVDEKPIADVDPEPRLLRLQVLDGASEVTVDFNPIPMFEVSAYDANLQAIEMDVDLHVDAEPENVLKLEVASETLNGESEPAKVFSATPVEPGTAKIIVTPRLLSMPACISSEITVVEF